MQSRLALHSQFSHLHLPRAGAAGLCPCTLPASAIFDASVPCLLSCSAQSPPLSDSLRVTSFVRIAIVPVLSHREQRNDSVVFLSQYREVIHNSKEVLSLLQEKSPAFKPVLAVIQVSAGHGVLLLLCDVI